MLKINQSELNQLQKKNKMKNKKSQAKKSVVIVIGILFFGLFVLFVSANAIFPQIDFISPTPSDGSVSNENVTINTTITDASDTSAWLDWNKSLVGYWGFDYYNSTGVFDNSSYDNFGVF